MKAWWTNVHSDFQNIEAIVFGLTEYKILISNISQVD